MDTPANGGRDSRFNLNNYEMPILNSETGSDIYNSSILHSRPTSITSGLARSSVSLTNSCGPSLQRSLKRTASDLCYDQNMPNRPNLMTNDCSADIMEDSYSPNHQKNSPLSNGKKTKGRVKIKMEYIDNKLRRYTTFSKRKTGIMKKAYELSTLTGTQVMLLVASETGHVYTFATRKLQPMITSESGKALIQTCLNSPDPCPSGSGDQRMSATGFEETELSYNIGDDEKVDSLSCSSYRSDSSDSSDAESVSGSSPPSPPPLISLRDLQASSSATSSVTKPDNGICTIPSHLVVRKSKKKNSPSVKQELSMTVNGNSDTITSDWTASVGATANLALDASNKCVNGGDNGSNTNGVIFTLDQLQRDFGIHTIPAAASGMPYITIPLLTGIPVANSNPPVAHQSPADLSNRSRK